MGSLWVLNFYLRGIVRRPNKVRTDVAKASLVRKITVEFVNDGRDMVLEVVTCVVALAALFLFSDGVMLPISGATASLLDFPTKLAFTIVGQVLPDSLGNGYSFAVLRWRNIIVADCCEGATRSFYVRKVLVCGSLVSRYLLLSID